MSSSTGRRVLYLGGAASAGNLAQLAWLAAGSRAATTSVFGAVLAAQALYGVLQVLVDNGPASHGARLAASGELNDAMRRSLVLIRLRLASFAGCVGLAIASAGGTTTFLAFLPFAAALVAFALLNVWEPYGRGDSAPWATYLALRSVGLAAVAVLFLAVDASFPVALAGGVECAIIVATALSFRLRPMEGLRRTLRAAPAPTGTITRIGLPALVGQAALASGTVLLNTVGLAAAAATYGVGLRLLTGMNAVNGVIVTALFPRLARVRGSWEAAEKDDGAVRLMLRSLAGVCALASGVSMLLAPALGQAFLGRSGPEVEATMVLALGVSGASVSIMVVTSVLVARREEAIVLGSYALGAALTLTGGLLVLVAEPDRPALVVAGALAGGQCLNATVLAVRAAGRLPKLRGPMVFSAAAAIALACTAALAAIVPGARVACAATLFTVGGGAVASVLSRGRDGGARR